MGHCVFVLLLPLRIAPIITIEYTDTSVIVNESHREVAKPSGEATFLVPVNTV